MLLSGNLMAIRCPKCSSEYDVTLFEFGQEIVCTCGTRLGMKHEEVMSQLKDICASYELELEEENLSEIQRAADKITFLILNTDYQKVDIEIEQEKLKALIGRLFPEKIHLYELIYASRFNRLWEQFRGE
ncbi:MAG: hypothetical protein A3G87_02185 [Omnitrophica bacterium RIFCSPLOWO2_12_FULL_50_11]|nr:MAG: hypothetical protein A3G87_02185 [Omnitrophica bacterium RIFCSPLOWO2_12_FULL_50_11]